MHTLMLKLKTSKYQKMYLSRIFYIAYKIYVITTKYASKQLRLLKKDKRYKLLLKEYSNLKSKTLSKEEKELLKSVKSNLNDLIKSYNLTQAGLYKFIKEQQHLHRKTISSLQAQALADNILTSVEKVLYSNGKSIHIKPFRKFNTISQKNMTNGLVLTDKSVKIFNQRIKILYKNTDYENESLSSKCKYLELKRIEFNGGYDFYINFVLKDAAPKKLVPGKCETGIDLGVSTVAAVNKTACTFEELAPKCKEYNLKIQRLQRLIDLSTRATNSELFNSDGTAKCGSKGKFKYSRHCKYLKRKLRVLYRKKSDYTLCLHNQIINHLVKQTKIFKVEDMDFKALVKRSKNTERSDKPSEVNNRTVYKYKKKKRFGKSINDRSPGQFKKRLDEKCKQYNLEINLLESKNFKFSQYNHDSDTYIKLPLSARKKMVNGCTVQRDLYSAYLISNVVDNKINRNKCKRNFNNFLINQDKEIARRKAAGLKNPNFGM